MPTSDSKAAPHRTEAGKAASDRRAERLSQALRENLKRRKAQARGRTETGPEDPSTGDSA